MLKVFVLFVNVLFMVGLVGFTFVNTKGSSFFRLGPSVFLKFCGVIIDNNLKYGVFIAIILVERTFFLLRSVVMYPLIYSILLNPNEKVVSYRKFESVLLVVFTFIIEPISAWFAILLAQTQVDILIIITIYMFTVGVILSMIMFRGKSFNAILIVEYNNKIGMEEDDVENQKETKNKKDFDLE